MNDCPNQEHMAEGKHKSMPTHDTDMLEQVLNEYSKDYE